MHNKKNPIFIFDLDGTITKKEILPELAKKISKYRIVKKMTNDAISGKTSFNVNFLERVKILNQLDDNVVDNVVDQIELDTNFLKFIKKNNSKCIIVTQNLDKWIRCIQKKINCPIYSSTAITKNGKVYVKKILKKEEVLKKFENKFTVAIGDGMNDYNMLKRADLGILFGKTDVNYKKMINVIDYYSENSKTICQMIQQL
jgi:HAD superfamily phosphoserine phosphatase-like hydrolase